MTNPKGRLRGRLYAHMRACVRACHFKHPFYCYHVTLYHGKFYLETNGIIETFFTLARLKVWARFTKYCI